jgi:ribosomal protein S14
LEKLRRRKSLLKHNKGYITSVTIKLGSIHLANDKFAGQRRRDCSFRGQETYFISKYRMMKHVMKKTAMSAAIAVRCVQTGTSD